MKTNLEVSFLSKHITNFRDIWFWRSKGFQIILAGWVGLCLVNPFLTTDFIITQKVIFLHAGLQYCEDRL